MEKSHWLLFPLMTLLACQPALACSCAAEKPEIDAALRAATVVVLADLVSSKQRSIVASAGRVFVTEDAEFRIVEVFKGRFKLGDRFKVRSELGPFGPCGVSVKNAPVWLEEEDGTPTRLSGRWLIFSDGKQPFELSRCGSSAPVEVVQDDGLQRLRSLKDQLKPQSTSR